MEKINKSQQRISTLDWILSTAPLPIIGEKYARKVSEKFTRNEKNKYDSYSNEASIKDATNFRTVLMRTGSYALTLYGIATYLS